MFTGIVQTSGIVTDVQTTTGGRALRIRSTPPLLAKPGDSISISGVCLTVATAGDDCFSFDIIRETLSKTTLGELVPGRRVNLEPSLRVGDRLDGHFVQGHVDGTAIVARVVSGPEEHLLWLRPQPQLTPYLVPKGSVAVDGVSLTIAAVEDSLFCVALIPTTLERTTLGSLRVGGRVNIESDILVRTIIHHLRSSSSDHASLFTTLQEAGFA